MRRLSKLAIAGRYIAAALLSASPLQQVHVRARFALLSASRPMCSRDMCGWLAEVPSGVEDQAVPANQMVPQIMGGLLGHCHLRFIACLFGQPRLHHTASA